MTDTIAESETLFRGFVPELEIRSDVANPDHKGRIIEGIAVPYNRPQRINAELTEQFERGAFNHQLGAAHRVTLAREHEMLGGTRIGRALELRDDASGLWGSFLVSRTSVGADTLELVRDGALDELSIGFRTRPRGQRTVMGGDGAQVVSRTRADMFETAIVGRGAYGRGATVKGLRSEVVDEIAEIAADPDRAANDAQAREQLARLQQILAKLPPLPLLP